MAKGGFGLARMALEHATLKASEIIDALNDMKEHEGYSAHNALENGHHEAIGYGKARRSRHDSPQPRPLHSRNNKASSSQRPATSYNSAQEWLEYSHNRGVLVEELYKRPNWRQFVEGAGQKDTLRKKLLSMSSSDLADILVKLDHM